MDPRSRPAPRSRRKPPPGEAPAAPRGPDGYTTREVADALDLPTSRIRAWARQGLLTPVREADGSYLFSFQDVALLRGARELLDAELSVRRVREALERLRHQLPAGRPLSAVRLEALGGRVLVTDGERRWRPESGQLEMALPPEEGGRPAPDAAPGAASPVPTEPSVGPGGSVTLVFPGRAADGPDSADAWYDAAVDVEASDAEEAKDRYRKALEFDPDHPDAHLNLGRLLHEEGALDQAVDHYRSALAADPESARAFYNLGVALEDKGLRAGAVEAYQAALRLDPALAVAHFNVSRLLEGLGRPAEALRHLATYKRLLDQGGRKA